MTNTDDQMPKMLLPRLYERDIDVLLQEEFRFSPDVCAIFAKALRFDDPIQINECQLSVVDETGETDLVASFSSGKRRGLILLENKSMPHSSLVSPNGIESVQGRSFYKICRLRSFVFWLRLPIISDQTAANLCILMRRSLTRMSRLLLPPTVRHGQNTVQRCCSEQWNRLGLPTRLLLRQR